MAKPEADPFAAAQPVPAVPLDDLLLRLGLAAGLGLAVAAVYYFTQPKKRAEAASFVATLIMLSILLAMVSMVVGSDIARAFSLAGVLAIVRFRTVVEDTRDTAFVIFAVITGMAVGADAARVPAIGIPIIAVVAWAMRRWGGTGEPPAPGTLVVRLGLGADPGGPLAETLRKHTTECRLASVVTARQGAALDLHYAVRLRTTTTPLALIADVNRVEGVQGVEWGESKVASS